MLHDPLLHPDLVVQTPMTSQQKRVVKAQRKKAKARSKKAAPELVAVAKSKGISEADLEIIKAHVRNAEVTINIPVDRFIDSLGKDVATLLEESGQVKNVFETGFSGGDNDTKVRERVERNLFGYKKIDEGSSLRKRAERPRYAGVNATHSASGAADTSSYGQSALVLTEEARARMTLTNDDTFSMGRDDVGTFDDLDHVLLARISDSMGKMWADTILAHATGKRTRTQGFGYMEAQVHGGIDLERDVAAVRADFAEAFGTGSGEALLRIAGTKPVIWGRSRLRDQFISTPPDGTPGKRILDRKWRKVKADRDADLVTPSPSDPVLAKHWDDLLATLPLAHVTVTDGKMPVRKRDAAADKMDKQTAEQVKALLIG